MGRMAYAIYELATFEFLPSGYRTVAVQPALIPPDADLSPGLEMKLFEDVLHVFLHSARTAFQNLSDVVVALSGNDPFDDLQLASCQIGRLGLGNA